MKKIVILILVAMMSFNIYAQSVSDNTSYKWITWTSMEKSGGRFHWSGV